MQRSATFAGPGIARVPASHRPTVASSTSRAAAVSRRFSPSAAIAARSSSADNDAILAQRQALGCQHRANGFQRVILRKRVGQTTIRAEQRQSLRTVNATRYEADRIGGKGGHGLLAHARNVVPLALVVNHEIAASAADRAPAPSTGMDGISSLTCAAAGQPAAAALSEGAP